jgi:hypothetical protein
MPGVVIRSHDDNNVLERCTADLSGPLSFVTGSQFAEVGKLIDVQSEEGFLRGHGTTVVDERLVASVCGIVERVDKLVSVRAVRNR